jgi:hypothetical protein
MGNFYESWRNIYIPSSRATASCNMGGLEELYA